MALGILGHFIGFGSLGYIYIYIYIPSPGALHAEMWLWSTKASSELSEGRVLQNVY